METINLHGTPFHLHNNDLISHYIKSSNDFYEVETFNLFKSYIPNVGTFLDIGANIGNHSLMFALNYPKIQIYAFEPSIVNFPLLYMNTRLRSNIGLFKIALGSNNDSVHMNYSDPNNKGNIKVDVTGEKVPVMKLDSLNLPDITFIKLDVEGHEYSVIEGAFETINKYKPVIWIEDFNQDTINLLKEKFNYVVKLGGPFNNFLLLPNL
jgi:FkbM family methyltransferase